MRHMRLHGAVRGRPFKATIPDDIAAHPTDSVNRAFVATRLNHLWATDLTYVATWRGFAYVALRHRCLRALHRGLAHVQLAP